MNRFRNNIGKLQNKIKETRQKYVTQILESKAEHFFGYPPAIDGNNNFKGNGKQPNFKLLHKIIFGE